MKGSLIKMIIYRVYLIDMKNDEEEYYFENKEKVMQEKKAKDLKGD